MFGKVIRYWKAYGPPMMKKYRRTIFTTWVGS